VQFLPIGGKLKSVVAAHQIDVLVRLLLQTRPAVFHIMNSKLAWEAVARNGLALREYMKLYASLYCDDLDDDDKPVGYARAYLPRCHPVLERVVPDNHRNWHAWVAEMAVPESLFSVLPFPAPAPAREGGASGSAQGQALLWAGRLDRQKRPDVLVGIARALPSFRFDVHGVGVWQAADTADLRALPNVRLHGAYEHFGELVKPDHVAFIYTTAWDGMPNILMEAAAAGLPIVAPDVGGISDFLAPSQLVESCDDVAKYVEAILRLAASPSLREAHVAAMSETIAKTRAKDAFVANLSQLMHIGATIVSD
jgi:glycosyltransferase involved in cell wall biosynthesis